MNIDYRMKQATKLHLETRKSSNNCRNIIAIDLGFDSWNLLKYSEEYRRTEKFCPGCNSIKNINDFNLDNFQLDGYENACRNCRAKSRKANKSNRNKLLDKQLNESLPFTQNFTKEAVYILGLIWADGHVEKNSNKISLRLSHDDAIQLKPLFEKFG